MRRKRGVIFKSGPSNVALFFAGAVIASWIAFLLASGFPLFAWVYYQVVPSTSSRLASLLEQVARESDVVAQEEVAFTLPPVDPGLLSEPVVRIPKIGVETEILERPFERYEEALRRGVWRVPDFATPEETYQKPLILVGHRFGYLEWSNNYRRQNSFFNLPKLKGGDEVEVVWGQRRYRYRITRVTEAEEIDDYSSDLILYTCKFLISPIKYFVYADRVN